MKELSHSSAKFSFIASRRWNQKVTTRFDQTLKWRVLFICTVTFLNGIHFLRHAADKHFWQILLKDLPQFKCPYCPATCKNLMVTISDNRTIIQKGKFIRNSKEKEKGSLIKRIDFHSKFVQNLDKEHRLYIF